MYERYKDFSIIKCEMEETLHFMKSKMVCLDYSLDKFVHHMKARLITRQLVINNEDLEVLLIGKSLHVI